jgi:hypothetical protein
VNGQIEVPTQIPVKLGLAVRPASHFIGSFAVHVDHVMHSVPPVSIAPQPNETRVKGAGLVRKPVGGESMDGPAFPATDY